MIKIKTNRVLATAKQPKIKDGGKAIEIYCASCRWDKKKKYYVCRSGFGLELPQGCIGSVRTNFTDYSRQKLLFNLSESFMRDKLSEFAVFVRIEGGIKPPEPFKKGEAMGTIYVYREEECNLIEKECALEERESDEEPTLFG